MNLEEIKEIFFAESSELLQRIESTLLSLEMEPDNPTERLDDLFRCIHTIKGSAGIFGFDRIVNFTHHLEGVLDGVREGKIPLKLDSLGLFLECRDLISDFVENIANGRDSDPETGKLEAKLFAKLKTYQAGELPPLEAPPVEPIAIEIAEEAIHRSPQIIDEILRSDLPFQSEQQEIRKGIWHVSLRFKENTFRHGLDPYPVFKYLQRFGEILNLFTMTNSVPSLDVLTTEVCHLGFEFVYKTDKDRYFIEDAFEFIRSDCEIYILEPGRLPEDILEFLKQAKEKKLRLIRILLFIGAITKRDLEEVFALHKIRRDIPEEPKEKPEELVTKPNSNSQLNQMLAEQVAEIQREKIAIQKNEIEIEKPESQEKKNKESIRDSKNIRVDLSKLDGLINLVGELVIASANLNQYSLMKNEETLQEISFRLGHLVSEIRDSALNLRMVPIGETFNRFQRVVRDICSELGKEVDFKVTGGETELDKGVIEKITDPLTHLVRNALDHGIEDSEERVRKGKPNRGLFHLHAFHETGNIVIEVKDDGRGLNKERILKKAEERNLLTPGREYSDSEIYRFILLPGFSTAEKVTNLSGRGVGMDVVLKNIESLRGNVTIHSEKDKGTNIQVRLPLTLAIIDGFLFQVGKSFFVVPLEQVAQCIEYKQEFMSSDQKDLINLRGKVLPFFKLSELFPTETNHTKKSRKNILVVRYMQREVGLLVDSLLGEFQTVIKPLGKLFSNLRGVAGTTILGNGEVALVLDIPHIFQLVVEREQFSFKKK
jgi:two-component system, chemotaxis family, sensor kinase CheA